MAVISEPPEVIWIRKGTHRPFDQLASVFTVFTILQEAFVRRGGGTPPPAPLLQLSCYRANLSLRVSLEGLIEAAQTGEAVDSIGLAFLPKEDGSGGPGTFQVNGLRSVIASISASSFSLFAERACEWIKLNVSTNYHQWPPVANFCRVVRNAVVHSGTVNIQSPTAPVVEWCGLALSSADFGKEIIGEGYLGPSDLVVLMLDLDDELNALGAPRTLV